MNTSKMEDSSGYATNKVQRERRHHVGSSEWANWREWMTLQGNDCTKANIVNTYETVWFFLTWKDSTDSPWPKKKDITWYDET